MSFFIKQAFLIALLLNMAVSFAYSATDADYIAGSNEIVAALNQPNTTLIQIVIKIASDLQTKQVACKVDYLLDQRGVADCLRGANRLSGELYKYIRYAKEHGFIDPIEAYDLSIAFSMITNVTNTSPAGIQVGPPTASPPSGNNVPLPSLVTYRQNKLAFAALRKAKGKEEVLPADLVKQMSDTFPRYVNGVGAVTPEQFLAAQMNRLQLNELAGVMVSATDFLARPDARITLYPANYASTSDQLKQLQTQEVALAQQILAETSKPARAELQAQLQSFIDQSDSLRKKDPVDELISERSIKNEQLQQDLMKLASPVLSNASSKKIGADLQSLVASLDDIDQQLAKQIRIEDLPPEDVQRFIINSLKSDFQALTQENAFQGMPLQTADTMLAAWVSGDLSSDALRALSQLTGLKEIHESVWSQALTITLDVGKTAMMAFPATAYIAIAISIFQEVQQNMAAEKEQQSNETHLIPLSPN